MLQLEQMLDDGAGARADRAPGRDRQALDLLRKMRELEVLEPPCPQRLGLGQCPEIAVRRVQVGGSRICPRRHGPIQAVCIGCLQASTDVAGRDSRKHHGYVKRQGAGETVMAGRRWKFWGWGSRATGWSRPKEQRLLAFYRIAVGLGDVARARRRRVEEIALRPPRLRPPASLARLLHRRALRAPAALATASRFPRPCGSSRMTSATRRTWLRKPRLRSRCERRCWSGRARSAPRSIPFGGGSSVVGGVEPVVGERFAGTISLDLEGLDQVLEVDRTSRAARIQGGMLGPGARERRSSRTA